MFCTHNKLTIVISLYIKTAIKQVTEKIITRNTFEDYVSKINKFTVIKPPELTNLHVTLFSVMKQKFRIKIFLFYRFSYKLYCKIKKHKSSNKICTQFIYEKALLFFNKLQNSRYK